MKSVLLFLISVLIGSASAKELHICYLQWEPYSYTTEKGAEGFSINIYKEALKRAGLKARFEELPWARCKKAVEFGKIDAAVDGGVSFKNAIKSKLFPLPWILMLWVRNESPIKKFEGYESLEGHLVGYVNGYGYPDEFLKNKKIQKHAVTSDMQGLRMLEIGRFEYFFGDLVNNRYLKNKYGLSLRPLLPPIKTIDLDLTFHESKKEEQARYEKALKGMFEDGYIDRQYQKYLGITYKEFLETYTD